MDLEEHKRDYAVNWGQLPSISCLWQLCKRPRAPQGHLPAASKAQLLKMPPVVRELDEAESLGLTRVELAVYQVSADSELTV